MSVDDIPYPSKPLTEDDIPMCTMALVDFSKTISLPLYGLKDGEYKYIVNDEFSGVFNVSNDNLSSDKQLVSFPDDDAIFDEMDDWRTENWGSFNVANFVRSWSGRKVYWGVEEGGDKIKGRPTRRQVIWNLYS